MDSRRQQRHSSGPSRPGAGHSAHSPRRVQRPPLRCARGSRVCPRPRRPPDSRTLNEAYRILSACPPENSEARANDRRSRRRDRRQRLARGSGGDVAILWTGINNNIAVGCAAGLGNGETHTLRSTRHHRGKPGVEGSPQRGHPATRQRGTTAEVLVEAPPAEGARRHRRPGTADVAQPTGTRRLCTLPMPVSSPVARSSGLTP